LILSNHDVVRGLRIINFKGAGIEIGACPLSSAGHSLVELNTLENNAKAGVLVTDPPRGVAEISVGVHNVSNTISKNTISNPNIPASAALIDLGGDGSTANDDGDPDVGPNTLLNFTDRLDVVASAPAPLRQAPGAVDVAAAGTVTLRGFSASPANTTVELFAVTRLRAVANRLIIEGVAYLQQAQTDATGTFTALGVAASPTGAYTATVTDQNGNTSELMFGCGGAAQAVKALDGGGSTLD